MTFVGEDVIDQTATSIAESEEQLLEHIEAFTEAQPFLASYFFSEAFAAFTDNEKEYALFLGLTLWKSIQVVNPDMPVVEEDDFIAAEEANLELLQEVSAKRFRDRLNVFFENTEQEDLLAFIEDSLIEDNEDNLITKEGRELLFIILKSIVDCLLAEQDR